MAFMWGPQLLAFALLSPVMMIGQWVSDRRAGKGDYAEARRKYLENARATGQRVKKLRRAETQERRDAAPDLADLRVCATDLDPALWERRLADADALRFRVGNARVASAVTLDIASGGGDDLRAFVEERCAPPEVMPFVPVTLSVHTHAAIGVAGDPMHALGVATGMVVQAATMHSPRELAICVAVPESAAGDWDWCKWLPHSDPLAAPLAGELVAVGADDSGDLLERILALVERRRVQRTQFGSEGAADLPMILLVIDETVVRARPRAARLLENAQAGGVRVVWMAREARDLPGECGEYLEVHDVRTGVVHRPTEGVEPLPVALDGFTPQLAREVGLALAPVVDHTTSQSLGGGIPVVSRLTDLLGMSEPTPEAVVRRWARPPRGLDAVIGEAADGPFHVDLRQDGPHGLIAGITGSGKSELLQSMVVSLAATYAPDRLNFLFVDYKGGTAFSSCTTLPHAVGMVTDLDGQLAQRVLISLNAELKRREHLLRELNARDLIDLETHRPQDAPPNLVIIIDEFAALAREVPDFIEGVVDIAQRGRSLGVHLLLATQRPSGVVNENIRANTNLRIALRVADSQDSADVLGRDDAAHIPRTLPGRAFARTGHSDFTSFQAAWAGGMARGAATSSGRSVRWFGLAGQKVLWCDETAAASTGVVTDLALLCSSIVDAARRSGHAAPKAPWLEPLAAVVSLESLPVTEVDPRDPASIVTYGLADLPAQQAQVPMSLNFETGGNVVIFGASGAGKSTLMRTIAAGAAAYSTPRDLLIYGIDAGAGGLDPLRALPNCGGIASGASPEMVTRVLSLFEYALGARRELLARAGAASVGDLRRRTLPEGSVPPPRMVLFIDNFGAFQTAFERVEYGKWIDLVQQLASEGRPAGIHVVISADRRASVPFGLLGVMSDRILLRAVDADELSGLGVPFKLAQSIKLGDGRALVGETEVQCAILGGDPSSDGQLAAIQRLGAALAERSAGVSAPTIQGLPDAFSISQIPAGIDALHPCIGVRDSAVGLEPVAIDLADGNVLVTGRKQSGRTSALVTIAQAIARTGGVEIHALCPRRTALADVAGLASATVGELAVADALATLADQAEAHERVTPFVVLLDDADGFSDHLAAADLERLITGPGRHAVRLVIALDPATVAQAYMGWVPEVRRFATTIAVRPDLESDGDLYGTRLTARPGQKFPAGRGFVIADREAIVIQLALPLAPATTPDPSADAPAAPPLAPPNPASPPIPAPGYVETAE
jgi:S-DNA-T family DNA segregation ATPase FtsK/SpoIIIE